MKILRYLLILPCFLGSLLLLSGCVVRSNDVIVGTDWNQKGPQYKALAKIVQKFNQTYPHQNKIQLKRIERARIDAAVGTGILGVRKLPNLYISYADFILKHDLTLQENQTNVKIRDLNQVIKKDDIIDQFLQETMYQNKLYVAPIGKSVDYMFINKRLVAEIFAELSLSAGVKALLGADFDFKTIRGQTGLIRIDEIKDPTVIVNYQALKSLTNLTLIKNFFKDWANVIKFSQTANTILKMQKDNKNVFILGIDDISASLIAEYANQGLLDDHTSIDNNFLFTEKNQIQPVINASGNSAQVFNNFLLNLETLKALAPRTFSNPNRNYGIRLKTGRDDYNSIFFINNQMMINIGSSGGIDHLTRKEVKARDILALPLPASKQINGYQAVMQQGPGIAMFELLDQQKNKRAEEFIQYLTRPLINQEYAISAGYLPIHRRSYQTDSYFLQKLENSQIVGKDLIKDIINTIDKKVAVYKTAPLTFTGGQVRYQVINSILQNFIEDINNGKYDLNGVSIAKTWENFRKKLSDQFSGNFIWKD